jgi:hypothetical protein
MNIMNRETRVLLPTKYLITKKTKRKISLIVFQKPLNYVVLTSSLEYSAKFVRFFLGNLKEYKWLDSSSCSELNGFEIGAIIPLRIRLMLKLRFVNPMKFFLRSYPYVPLRS